MKDLHSTHIYMDSISWGTKRREEDDKHLNNMFKQNVNI